MSTKMVASQPSTGAQQKPGHFYLKKWLIIIVTVGKLFFALLAILGMVILLVIKPGALKPEGGNTEGENNATVEDKTALISEDIDRFKPFIIFFLVLNVITAVCEIAGLIGTYREHLQLVKLYFGYCLVRSAINLTARLIFTSRTKHTTLWNSSQLDYLNILFDAVFTLLFAVMVFYYFKDLRTIEEERRNPRAAHEEAMALNA